MENLPRHIAIIMDGNGRWAEKNGLPKLKGHEAGMRAMKKIVRHCGEIGIDHLTVYAFSTENWKRAKEEVQGLFNILVYFVDKELKELDENNVKVRIIGDYSEIPAKAKKRLDISVERTKNNTGLNFNIAINYGSRDEIVRAVNKLVESGKCKVESEEDFSEHLFTAGIPDPDLIIRTSGEKRLSNFLLWQAAYSEFVFVDTLWPDFDEKELDSCLKEYAGRKRRFGGR
jgi:undecaprenyl diphosphate synthase